MENESRKSTKLSVCDRGGRQIWSVTLEGECREFETYEAAHEAYSSGDFSPHSDLNAPPSETPQLSARDHQ